MTSYQAPSEENQKSLLAKLHEALKNVNDHWLNKPGYIAGGDKLTMADLRCFSEIEQLRFYANFDWSPYPNVQRYREHMTHVPHYAEIFAPLQAFASS